MKIVMKFVAALIATALVAGGMFVVVRLVVRLVVGPARQLAGGVPVADDGSGGRSGRPRVRRVRAAGPLRRGFGRRGIAVHHVDFTEKRLAEGIALAKAAGKYRKAPKLTAEGIAQARSRIEQGVPKARVARSNDQNLWMVFGGVT